MRYLTTGDYHIDEHNRIDDFLIQLNIIEEQSKKVEYDYYLNMGDVFEHKKPTPFELKIFANHLRNIQAKNKIVVIGNHDELSEELSSLDWLPEGIIVVKSFNLKDNGKLIHLAHRTVSEAKTGLDWRLNEISYKDLAKQTKADIIILGHIHTPQIINKENPLVLHPGSIERNTFGERNDDKCIWDLQVLSNTIKLKKIDLDIRPMKYVIFNLDTKEIKVNDKIVKKLDIKDSIVKVDVIGAKDKIKKINYDKLLDKFSGTYKLDFDFIYSDTEDNTNNLIEGLSLKSDKEIFRQYIEQNGLDKKLIKFGEKIIDESN